MRRGSSRAFEVLGSPAEQSLADSSERPIRYLVMLAAFAVGFDLHWNEIQNHFWRFWPYLYDSAWLGWILDHGGLSINGPPSVDSDSFFRVHMSPALVPIGVLLRSLTNSHIDGLALYCGFAGGLLALSVASAALSYGPTPIWQRCLLAFGSSVVVVGGYPVAAIAGYPHLELLIAAAICLFLEALARGWAVVALASFALASLVREDGGAQIASFLLTAWAGEWLFGTASPHSRKLLRWGLAGLAMTGCLVALQFDLFGDLATFGRVYSGTPPWAHLTGETIESRLMAVAAHRLYIILPLLAGPLAAAILRRPALSYGTIAVIPWLALQLTAANEAPADWRLYYTYPVVPALFWPLVADRVLNHAPAATLRLLWAPGLTLLALPFAIQADGIVFAANTISLFSSYSPQDRGARQAAMTDIAALARVVPDLMVDIHVAALLPDLMKPDRIIGLPGDKLVPLAETTHAVAYFRNGLSISEVREVLVNQDLVPRFVFRGTPIILALGPLAPRPDLAELDAIQSEP